ncbi:uncharacterized protein LOC133918033 [Phragmites australis]|uniref:uncharacterized protein LOC133918033 n=1 Tax=Phragmites australis TaxID=29695 RepID=UPI002D786035|nr:uncharacterized protein LOC133918033 [Phragmites australis]
MAPRRHEAGDLVAPATSSMSPSLHRSETMEHVAAKHGMRWLEGHRYKLKEKKEGRMHTGIEAGGFSRRCSLLHRHGRLRHRRLRRSRPRTSAAAATAAGSAALTPARVPPGRATAGSATPARAPPEPGRRSCTSVAEHRRRQLYRSRTSVAARRAGCRTPPPPTRLLLPGQKPPTPHVRRHLTSCRPAGVPINPHGVAFSDRASEEMAARVGNPSRTSI